MCGIAGIVEFQGRPPDRAALERMSAALTHRGPDAAGLHCAGPVGLAHRRLSIIDPKTGAQPRVDRETGIALAFNGEVYNYREIRRELADAYPFHTQSDTEVVLHAYQKWGIDCLQRFRGMFAFALHDPERQRLFLVRDRVGIKPLYYWHGPERLLFASELTALIRSELLPQEIDREAVAHYFRYQYIPAPWSIYQNVRKLEPGHYYQIDLWTGEARNESYWSLSTEPRERPEAEALEELNATLAETLDLYLRADVTFGAFLSGGVDSSLVCAVAAEQLAEPLRTFSIGFHEQEHSELPFAREASERIGSSHSERIVTPEIGAGILETLAVHFGEPFGDSSAIPTYFVSREAAADVKMVLSGDGGDELFAGYDSYQTSFRDHDQGDGLLRRLLDGARGRAVTAQAKHDAQREIFDEAALARVLGGPLPGRLRGFEESGPDPVTRFQAQDFKTYLVDDVLTKVDRTSMAHSLEVRVPLLDHKIVELAFSLPLSMKMQRAGQSGAVRTKHLLRRSAGRFYSDRFLDRPKMGFGIPIVQWCRGPLRELLNDELQATGTPLYDWVEPREVQEMLRRFFAGEDRWVARLWSLLMFAVWMRQVHLGGRS